MNGNKNNYSEWWLAVMPLIDNKSRYLYAVTSQQIVAEIKWIRDKRNLCKIVSHFLLDIALEPNLDLNCNTISTKLGSQIPKESKLQTVFPLHFYVKNSLESFNPFGAKLQMRYLTFSHHENWWNLSCFYQF